MAYMSPDLLSANWSYDSAIDLFSLNTMNPESFPMDNLNDMLWDPKDLPADFFAPPTDISGFTVPNDDSLSSDQESDDQAYSPTHFMSSTPPAIGLPGPIALTTQPANLSLTAGQKRKASTASSSTGYASSPELRPLQPMSTSTSTSTTTTTSRKSRANSDDSTRGRNAAKRAAHNIIEKRYRTNMNAKFVALENAMSSKSAGVSKPSSSSSITASGAKTSASLKKSEILSNAIAYMHELQETNEQLRKELAALNQNMGRVSYR